MKRTATLLAFVCFSFFAPVAAGAQTIAPDFTIVTTDGVTRNLYSVLDSGKTVVLDFFYPSCQGCWYYSPVIEQCYQNNGAGTGNVQYWGINGGFLESDAQINAYRTQYGITNPCASGLQGNGEYVDSLYQATFGTIAYPAYAVVCPDHHIYWNVNYPPTMNGFNPYIIDSCGTLGITLPVITRPVSIFPNPATGDATIHFTNLQPATTLSIFTVEGKCVETTLVPGDQFQLPANRFAPGVYTCVFTLEDGSRQHSKFIVQ